MADTTGADTARGTVTELADTDAATVTMVTTGEAARLARVSVRTVRRWIQHGHLPCVETETGKLVSPADIPEARRRASGSRGHGRGRGGHGHDDGHVRAATATATATGVASVPARASAQLEAIRDEWLQPLVTRIEELSRENGRLQAERDQAARERDALAVEVARLQAGGDAAEERQDAPHATEPAGAVSPPPRPWWRLWGR